MRLTGLQKILWAAAGVAVLAYGALMVFSEPASVPVAEATFRPTFDLPDSENRLRTPADFEGKHLLVFFGFTNCPDVCPTTLAEVAQVMDDLGDDADRVQPLFISIDPERDRRPGTRSRPAPLPTVSGSTSAARTMPPHRMAIPCRTVQHFT